MKSNLTHGLLLVLFGVSSSPNSWAVVCIKQSGSDLSCHTYFFFCCFSAASLPLFFILDFLQYVSLSFWFLLGCHISSLEWNSLLGESNSSVYIIHGPYILNFFYKSLRFVVSMLNSLFPKFSILDVENFCFSLFLYCSYFIETCKN